MSLSGLGRLCNIKRQSIKELLDTLKSDAGKQYPESLQPFAGKDSEMQANGYKNITIIKDEVCTAVVEYYAFDARKTTPEAKHFYRQFAKVGMRSWIQSVTGWAEPKQAAAPPHWYRRLMLFRSKTKIPVGYWCVFEEIVNLVSTLEHLGYTPPLGVVPDISVGKCWANYMRKELDIEPKDVGMKYKHYYPDWEEPVEAYIYPLEHLATFRMWVEETYKPKKMLIYFRKADSNALPSACKLLGLPEGK